MLLASEDIKQKQNERTNGVKKEKKKRRKKSIYTSRFWQTSRHSATQRHCLASNVSSWFLAVVRTDEPHSDVAAGVGGGGEGREVWP